MKDFFKLLAMILLGLVGCVILPIVFVCLFISVIFEYIVRGLDKFLKLIINIMESKEVENSTEKTPE